MGPPSWTVWSKTIHVSSTPSEESNKSVTKSFKLNYTWLSRVQENIKNKYSFFREFVLAMSQYMYL